MKKNASKKILLKEAAYWNSVKELAKTDRGSVCSK